MGSLAWRALGQAALIYAIGASAVTAQDTQPGRTAFAEMIAFARLGSVPCERVVPDVEGFHALALQRNLSNRHSPRKRLAPKKRTLSGFEIVSGLTDGAGVMPARWNRPVFWFRFYEGKISSAFFALVAPRVGAGRSCPRRSGRQSVATR